MQASDDRDHTERPGGRRTSRPRRGPLAAALPALLLLCIILGLAALATAAAASAAPPMGATATGFSAQALAARGALQQAELFAFDLITGDRFGCAVAIEGDTALVGAKFHSGDSGPGAVYVFVRSGDGWAFQAELTGNAAAGDGFGYSVALSGETAVVGAPGTSADTGAAYVFVRSGGVWTQQQKLTAVDGAASDWFGRSVAISGETAVVGAQLHTVAGQWAAGAAYVFVRIGGPTRLAWTLQQKLTAADGAASDQFGASVALQGETALVGAPNHDPGGQPLAGAAYVFTRSASSWSQQAELNAADGARDDAFGTSVALSGETALVGAIKARNAGNVQVGAAYVFTRSSTAWMQQAKLFPAGLDSAAAANAVEFGTSVALSGQTAVVGAPGHEQQATPGAAYVFTRSGSIWISQPRLTAADGADRDELGRSVSVSGDTVLVGAPVHTAVGVPRAGSAYVFLMTPSITRFQPTAGPVGASVTIVGGFFNGVTAVAFNGAAATGFIVLGVQITVSVPPGATTGPITVTTPVGSATSATSFTVVPAPTITSFTPTAGPVGKTVTLTGTGFTGATAVAFNGTAATVFYVVSDTQIVANVPAGAATGAIVVTTLGGSATSAAVFTVLPAPTIKNFLPTSGPVGTTVTLTGTGFTGASMILFGGLEAASFSVVSDTLVTAIVAAGTPSGTIELTTPGGIVVSAASFTVTASPKPQIAKLKPAFAKRGGIVTISGKNFGASQGTGSVEFGSKTCTEYLSWSDTRIKCRVPAKAGYDKQKVTVTTPGGTSNARSFWVRR